MLQQISAPRSLLGASLPSNSSNREFQQGRVGYMPNFVEQAFLLPRDIEELRNLMKHNVFLILKRDLAMVSS